MEKMATIILSVVAIIVLGLYLMGGTASKLPTTATPEKYDKELHIYSKDTLLTTFDIQIADTPLLMRTGLMHRTSMPAESGMLFIFESPRISTMWMKNTHISLDMLFMDKDGTISEIVTHTTPFSEKTIKTKQKIKYVLEINAGISDKEGIEVGDRIDINQILRQLEKNNDQR